MPRTSIPVTQVAFQTGIPSVAFTTADFANGNMLPNDGSTPMVVLNPTAGIITMTLASVPDEAGRTGDQALAIPAAVAGQSGVAFVPTLRPAWWSQRTADQGYLYINWSAAGCKIAALAFRD